MLESTKLSIRLSEMRSKINAIQRTPDPSDEQRAERDKLADELQASEVEYRQALADEDAAANIETRATPDSEARERMELRGRASFGAYLGAALAGRLPGGAEAEFGEALGVPAGHVPLDLFESDRPAPVEYRADAATHLPSTGAGSTLAPIQPYVFAESIAPRLGIDMPSVGSGAHSEMTITTAQTAGAKAKGAAVESTEGALTPTTAKPRRVAARLTLRVEDIAEIGQSNVEEALKQNVRAALSAQYDDQCINGNGTAPNVNGLINQLTDPTNPTDVVTFDAYLTAFADQIDGLWAERIGDVAILTNVDAYKLSAKTFRDKVIDAANKGAASLGDVTAADYLASKTGGWWANARMPDTASNIARGIVYRKGRPGLRTAVHPTWGSITIDDVYTSAASGQRHFTVSVLVGDKVLMVQPSAYGLVEFKVS